MADYMNAGNGNTVVQWWKEKKEKVHDAVFEHIKYLDNNQGYRRIDNLRNMRLYGNLKILGLGAGMYNRTESDDQRKNRVTLNIVQSMCDTITNKVAKNKVRIQFLTDGGSWTAQQKAKKLTKFIEGQFFASKIYTVSPYVFLDCTVFDIGALKIYEADGKVCAERVFPDEIRVDEAEGVYGEPLQMHQEKDIPREVLLKMFPKFKEKIEAAETTKQPYLGNYRADLVHVVESWKRKTSSNDMGKHAISIDNCTLLSEDYAEEYFPFAFLKWAPRLRGFYGQSLAERLTGKQLEINKILRTIQVAQHLVSVPKVLIDVSSDIVSAHINNQVGGIVKYRGLKPDYITPNAVNSELYNHLNFLIQSSYEEAGISQLAAQSKKPAGLDSGKALREFSDIETERFVLTGQEWENFHLEVARQMIRCVKKIWERDGEFKVKLKGKRFLETIDWGEIDLEEDQYTMQCFPTSFLSQTPAGRLQDVTELYQAGFIDKENAMGLLDFPDLESFTTLATAQNEDMDKIIETMIDKGDFVAPEPYQNLQMGVKKMMSAYIRAKIDEVPEDRLELMRRWIEMANQMLTPPIPQAGDPGGPQMPAAPEMPPDPAMMAPEMDPLAEPMPAPQSPLVPQV